VTSRPSTPVEWLDQVTELLKLYQEEYKNTKGYQYRNQHKDSFNQGEQNQAVYQTPLKTLHMPTTPKQEWKRMANPPTACRFCESRGKQLYHWQSQCRQPYLGYNASSNQAIKSVHHLNCDMKTQQMTDPDQQDFTTTFSDSA
jgi:hypothetical protein